LTLALGFEATAPSNCAGGTQKVTGSWTVTLTSVTAYQGDAGSPAFYTAHGQVTASLVGAGPSDAATFALAF
jgi:hypothetical protein